MLAIVVFWFLVGLVIGTPGFLVINRKLKWYIPTVTNMELSKQLSVNIQALGSATEKLNAAYGNVLVKAELFTKIVTEVELQRDLITDVLKAQAYKQLQTIHPDVINHIIRDVAPTVANELSRRLQPTVDFATEYVLLHSLDAVEFNVTVTPASYHAHELRQAIKRACEYRHHRLPKVVDDKSRMEYLMEVARNDQEFELFLGRVGKALLDLRLEGVVALKRKQLAPTSMQIPNSDYDVTTSVAG